MSGLYTNPPDGYVVPEWPALYAPWKAGQYLYYASSIWYYTVYWTLCLEVGIFAVSGLWAALVFGRRSRRHIPYALAIPVVFTVSACLWGLISSTIIAFGLAAVYNAAFLRMSTWVPLLWALAQALVVVISSYTTLTNIL